MGLLDKLNSCVCGHEFSKDEIICPKCGKKKFSLLHLDGSHGSAVTTNKKKYFSMTNLCNDILDDFSLKK